MPLFKTMNIKITVNGTLYIERPRPGKPMWIEQKCPFACPDTVGLASCGDWCGHFQTHGAEAIIMRGQIRERVQGLTLCHGTELFGTISDERATV